jgi:hypothetical protein
MLTHGIVECLILIFFYERMCASRVMISDGS